MPPRKRRAPAAEDAEVEDEDVQRRQRHSAGRRRTTTQDEAEMQDADEAEEDYGEEGEEDDSSGAASSEQQMVKNLVRLALACEHSRTPLRRSDINVKCLNGHSRRFKHILAASQLALRQTFGMDLVELPPKEKYSIAQRRAAQKAASQGTQTNTANKQYMLVSILPDKYKDPSIIPSSRAPDDDVEAAYMALYTLVVTLVALYSAPMPERLLERSFARMNAAETTPVDRFDKLLERMTKHGYIVRIKDMSGGEETIEYVVGPRGKREIGSEGIAGLVRTVYGSSGDSEQSQELEKKLEQSLKFANVDVVEDQAGGVDQANSGPGPARRRGRPARRLLEAEEDEEDDADNDEHD